MKFNSFKPLLALLGLLGLTSTLQSAHASVVVTSTVYWNNINVEIIDLSGGQNTPQFTWGSQQGGVNTSALTEPVDNAYDTQTAADFSSELTSRSTTAFASSHAVRSPSILQSQAQSDFGGSNNAQTSAFNEGYFEMRGKGIALISLDWKLEMSGVGNDFSGGDANISFSGNFRDQNGANSDSSKYVSITANDGLESKSGRYRFSVVGDGTSLVSGSFSVRTTANSNASIISAVPIPSAFWLFGSTLLALMGRVKRKWSLA